jgi:heme-degrading monooxygenase HmoA
VSDPAFAPFVQPPYYVVIFTSRRTPGENGYGAMAERMGTLAAAQPGYLGFESVRNPEGFGVTLSYWESPEAIRAWKDHAEHSIAQDTGLKAWYEHYEVRVARVERAYSGPDAARHATSWDIAGP